jgi:hypothetical protein
LRTPRAGDGTSLCIEFGDIPNIELNDLISELKYGLDDEG